MAIEPHALEGCVFLDKNGVVTNIRQDAATMSLGCLSQVVMSVLSWALGFLGLITLVFLFMGALKFITSSGDPKAIQGAQKTMTFAIIGAVFVLCSFILINAFTTALGLPNILTDFTLYQP